MNEAMNAAINKEEGRAGNIEAAPPASIAGLGAPAFTSAASAAPIIMMTMTKKAADAYLPAPAIVVHNPGNVLLLVVDTENTKP